MVMTHAAKGGESKLLPRCTLPLTGANCIRKVLTDLAYLKLKTAPSCCANARRASAWRRLSPKPPAG